MRGEPASDYPFSGPMLNRAGDLRMDHKEDPADELRRKAGSVDGIELFHNQILVAIYVRPERTRGGIILADVTRKEDIFQGKVGLVLKKGPLAFVDDARNQFQGQNVDVGDWIAFRTSDGWQLRVNGSDGQVPCRILEDVHVKARLTSPDEIY